MADIFAKLFDFDGYQVLATCDTHDETDAPLLTIRTQHAGLVVATAISFAATDTGDELRDKYFANLTAEQADELRTNLLSTLRIST